MVNSKRKGNQAERELLRILTEYGVQAHRNDQKYIGGEGNPDISAIIGPVSVHMECKRVERLSLAAALRQAHRDARNALPVVVHRRSREPWLVTMKLEELLEALGYARNEPDKIHCDRCGQTAREADSVPAKSGSL